MRVLVLGGSGFIGSHVVDALLEESMDVWSMDRAGEKMRDAPGGVKFFRNEFGNRGAQEDILKQGVDVIVHLISSTIPSSSNKDPVFDIQSNLVETVELLNLAVKHHVKRVVFVSSGGTIYGNQKKQPIPESASLWPLCSYGIVKSAIEKYLYMFQELYGIETVSIRLANPYGERQDPGKPLGAISVFLYKALKGEPIEIWGDGNIIRDYIYIEDVKKAVLRCVVQENISSCYNIGSGQACSLNDIIKVMNEMGLTPDVNYQERRGYDIDSVVLDCSRANRELGWKADISLRDGMKKSFDWLEEMVRSGKVR